ncbi:hypothetical protein REPUB_Repub14bG0041500 [Reevesia pubescens]
MEGSAGQKHKHLEFNLVAVSKLSSSSKPVIALFNADFGVTELRYHQDSKFIVGFNVDLKTSQLFKLGPVQCFAFARVLMQIKRNRIHGESPSNLETRRRAGTSILHLSNGRKKILFKGTL